MATKMKAKELEALDADRIKGNMKMQKADRDYFISHYQELLEKYRHHWVAISGGKLIISESNPDRLMETLNKTESNDMFIYYLADPEEAMIL